jgi:hypothetical protein
MDTWTKRMDCCTDIAPPNKRKVYDGEQNDNKLVIRSIYTIWIDAEQLLSTNHCTQATVLIANLFAV